MPAVLSATADLVELERRLSLAHGGGDGIIRGDGDEFAVTAQSPLSMSVDVGTGRGYIAYRWVRQALAVGTVEVSAPSGGNHRRDLVQFTLGVGVNIKTGVEDPSPSLPTLDANSYNLAEIYCRDTMTTVKDSDDATNGYIIDNRETEYQYL